ncbi:hypothetical protein EYF80_003673 [Liparis tanakae]|uniref:Uncharacterized protein n=1 Tax=Liparis tanakae TaxID=230148 RepID=A0A4Z2J7T9_9TELE|nr:hypothetical protein EYF80_003673 [Liparis tanakae]
MRPGSLPTSAWASRSLATCRSLPLRRSRRPASKALTTPARTRRRVGTGASRGTPGSKCATARSCGINAASWRRRKRQWMRRRGNRRARAIAVAPTLDSAAIATRSLVKTQTDTRPQRPSHGLLGNPP